VGEPLPRARVHRRSGGGRRPRRGRGCAVELHPVRRHLHQRRTPDTTRRWFRPRILANLPTRSFAARRIPTPRAHPLASAYARSARLRAPLRVTSR
jgi:hypothetical protein